VGRERTRAPSEVVRVGGQGQPQPTIALIFSSSTLTLIRDKADALCARLNVQGYEDCPIDIQAASGIAEDIRDALLDYQVGCGKAHTTLHH